MLPSTKPLSVARLIGNMDVIFSLPFFVGICGEAAHE
jgi:hypothetical protein